MYVIDGDIFKASRDSQNLSNASKKTHFLSYSLKKSKPQN